MMTATRERSGVDPVELLRDDHRRAQALFAEFESAEDARRRRRVADELLKELKVHAKIKEAVFYPAMRQKMDEGDILDQAAEEQRVLAGLVRELEKMVPSDERFTAKMKTLAARARRHAQDEEARVLPRVDRDGVEWKAVGVLMRERRAQLMETERGFAAATGGDAPPSRRRHGN